MKLIKVMFTEWRDAPGAAPVGELALAAVRVEDLLIREASLRRAMAESQEVRDITGDSAPIGETSSTELANVVQARIEARKAMEAAGNEVQKAMVKHGRVGSTGYQVLNDKGEEVLRLVDADGNELPAGAVYGYRVVDAAPPAPVWSADIVARLAAVVTAAAAKGVL